MRTLRFVALLCCALVFGLTLSHVLQASGSEGLSGPVWLQVQQTFYGGFAVVGGVAEILGLITAGILAVRLRSPSQPERLHWRRCACWERWQRTSSETDRSTR